MIRFIQNYTTKALPPEVFTEGQEVDRSDASELYLVQLGVAGYVHEGNLVDQDFRPIVIRKVEVVQTADRRFGGGGRGGETLGLDAPQRASAGPGNAVMFGVPDTDSGITQVQVDQLTSDLAASRQQLDDHRDLTTGQIGDLTSDLTAAQGAREAALADLAAANEAKATLAEERDAARADASTATARVTELEAALAAETSSTASNGAAATTTKPK